MWKNTLVFMANIILLSSMVYASEIAVNGDTYKSNTLYCEFDGINCPYKINNSPICTPANGLCYNSSLNFSINISGTGIENYTARWVNDTTLGTGIIRDNGKTIGINRAPSSVAKIFVNSTTSVFAMLFHADTYTSGLGTIGIDDYHEGGSAISMNKYGNGTALYTTCQGDYNNNCNGLSFHSLGANGYGISVVGSNGTGIQVLMSQPGALLLNITQHISGQNIYMKADNFSLYGGLYYNNSPVCTPANGFCNSTSSGGIGTIQGDAYIIVANGSITNLTFNASNLPVYNNLSMSDVVAGVGNWSSDKLNYNTTTELDTLYYPLNNPNGYINNSIGTIQSVDNYILVENGSLTNLSINESYLNQTILNVASVYNISPANLGELASMNITGSVFLVNNTGVIDVNDSLFCLANGSGCSPSSGGISTIQSLDSSIIVENGSETNISINSTYLNDTIIALMPVVVNGTDGINGTDGVNGTNAYNLTIYVNDTVWEDNGVYANTSKKIGINGYGNPGAFGLAIGGALSINGEVGSPDYREINIGGYDALGVSAGELGGWDQIDYGGYTGTNTWQSLGFWTHGAEALHINSTGAVNANFTLFENGSEVCTQTNGLCPTTSLLGYNTTSQLNTLFYNISNPVGYLNASGVVAAVGNFSAYIDIDWGINSSYIYNNSNSLTINETKLNATMDGRYIRNGTAANLTSIEAINNIVSDNNITAQYYFGQPMMATGSGIIWASSVTNDGNLNITYSGYNVTYPNMIILLTQVSSGANMKYCNITGATVTPPTFTHSFYYVDNNCAVQHTDFLTRMTRDISPGGTTDIFDVVSSDNGIETAQGSLMRARIDTTVKFHMFYTDNLKVVNGLAFTAGTWPTFNISSGMYDYLREVNPTTAQVSTAGNKVEYIYHNGSTTTWAYGSGTGLNVTHCDNGTALVACSNPVANYRRYFIFVQGKNDSTTGDLTQLYQTAALDSVSYSSLANCMDITTNPIVWNIPSQYQYTMVPLYAFCARRTESSWGSPISDRLMDLRSTKGNAGSTSAPVDTTVFLLADGTKTADYLNVTNTINTGGSINVSNAGSCIYLPGGGRLCGNTTCSSLYSPNNLTVMSACN